MASDDVKVGKGAAQAGEDIEARIDKQLGALELERYVLLAFMLVLAVILTVGHLRHLFAPDGTPPAFTQLESLMIISTVLAFGYVARLSKAVADLAKVVKGIV